MPCLFPGYNLIVWTVTSISQSALSVRSWGEDGLIRRKECYLWPMEDRVLLVYNPAGLVTA